MNTHEGDHNLSREDEFIMEEMKQAYNAIHIHQQGYQRLEFAAFSGVLVIYGFFLSSQKVPSHFSWWLIPVFLLIPLVRCVGHYLVIGAKITPYIQEIERKVFGNNRKDLGFQYAISRGSFRVANIAANMILWAGLIGGSALVALLHVELFGR